MFKYIISSIFVLCLAGEADAQVKWRSNYAAALKEASEKNRPIFVECYTDTCPLCRLMEKTTFQDPTIQAMLNTLFIPVKINDRDFFNTNSVSAVPTQLYFRSDGVSLSSSTGYVNARTLEARLNAEFARGRLNFNMIR